MKLNACISCRNYLVHTREHVVCSYNSDMITERKLAVNPRKERIIIGCPFDSPAD